MSKPEGWLERVADVDESALVRDLLDGNEAAFDRFADDYLPPLYRFAQRRLRDHDLSEEVVQAAACKAIAKLASFRGDAGLATWLCAICRNEIAAHFRRRGRRREVALDEEPVAGPGGAGADSKPGPEDELFSRERAELVHETLDALPPAYGRVLEWKYLERIPVVEIAGRLGVGPKAAESMLTRARRAFRELYRRLEELPARAASPDMLAEGAGRSES
jgi:RNA polymerase sigma-70 factor (ECF subfamily)